MQLPHPGYNRLGRFIVETHLKSGVFIGKFAESVGQPILVGPSGGFDSYGNYRLRELGRLQNQRLELGGDSVPGKGILQPHGGADIAGPDGFQLLPVVGVHLKQTPHSFPLPLAHIHHRRPGLHRPGINPQKHQPPHIGVRNHLERQGCQRLPFLREPQLRLFRLGVRPLHRRHIRRRRQIVNDGIQ